MRPRTVRQTHRHTQTRVTTIHFASSTTHPKCNEQIVRSYVTRGTSSECRRGRLQWEWTGVESLTFLTLWDGLEMEISVAGMGGDGIDFLRIWMGMDIIFVCVQASGLVLSILNFLLFVSEYLILFLHTSSVAVHHFWH